MRRDRVAAEDGGRLRAARRGDGDTCLCAPRRELAPDVVSTVSSGRRDRPPSGPARPRHPEPRCGPEAIGTVVGSALGAVRPHAEGTMVSLVTAEF